MTSNKLKQRIILGLGVSIWVTAIAIGFITLWDYSNRPGPEGKAPVLWPASSKLKFDNSKDKLVMFAHPQCPCSNASLEELAKLKAMTLDKLSIDVVFYHPPTFSIDWVKDVLWQKAKKIPDVTTWIDSRKYEIGLFHPQTSGQVYLYSNEGNLIYSGGITPSRSHVGDNRGTQAIRAWVLERKKIRTKGFVFGCTLFHDGHKESKI